MFDIIQHKQIAELYVIAFTFAVGSPFFGAYVFIKSDNEDDAVLASLFSWGIAFSIILVIAFIFHNKILN